jgi:hypothetical protein
MFSSRLPHFDDVGSAVIYAGDALDRGANSG